MVVLAFSKTNFNLEQWKVDLKLANGHAELTIGCSYRIIRNIYIIADKTCSCSEVSGTYSIDKKLKVGDQLCLRDIAGYSLVNLN